MAQSFYTNEHFVDIARDLIADELYASRWSLFKGSVDVRKNLQTFAETFEVRAKVYDTQLKKETYFAFTMALEPPDSMCVLSISEQFYIRCQGMVASLRADLAADDDNKVDIAL